MARLADNPDVRLIFARRGRQSLWPARISPNLPKNFVAPSAVTMTRPPLMHLTSRNVGADAGAIEGYCIGGGLGLAWRAIYGWCATMSFAIPAARLGLAYPARDRALRDTVGRAHSKIFCLPPAGLTRMKP